MLSKDVDCTTNIVFSCGKCSVRTSNFQVHQCYFNQFHEQTFDMILSNLLSESPTVFSKHQLLSSFESLLINAELYSLERKTLTCIFARLEV